MDDYQLRCEDCGRPFVNHARLFTHQKTACRPGKRGLSELLGDARSYWDRRTAKRARHSVTTSVRRLSHSANTAFAAEVVEATQATGLGEHLQEIPSQTMTARNPEAQHADDEGSSTFDNRSEDNSSGARYLDLQAEAPSPPTSSSSCNIDGSASGGDALLIEEASGDREDATNADIHGLFRIFRGGIPDRDPDAALKHCDGELGSVSAPPTFDGQIHAALPSNMDDFYPYPNSSSFDLGDWYWNRGTTKSMSDFMDLLKVITQPHFRTADLGDVNWSQVHKQLAEPLAQTQTLDGDEWIDDTDSGWLATSVVIDVPFPTGGKGGDVAQFEVGTLHHQSIVSVIKEKLSDSQQDRHLHYKPYKLMWQPEGSSEPMRVYGELYTSDEFLKADAEIQNLDLPSVDGSLERVVLALMFWTDATLLANFGTAKLWPCYMFFGNDSKYQRSSVSAGLCMHIAYFLHLPDHFKDWYGSCAGRPPSASFVAHCNREVFHQQWKILLSDELIEAMHHGIRIRCADNVDRMFFPRVFTYSADYPEKTLIATIRTLGNRPCPRCLIYKAQLDQMGPPCGLDERIDDDERQSLISSARKKIYEEGYVVGSVKVENLLKVRSMLPVENAFSRLSSIGFNVFGSLVVDLMHEFELGVWKSLFIHLIRILEAEDRQAKSATVSELDRRYRLMPTFGQDTIRQFHSNASEQKRLGARDYEDMLQCAIPVFDGLLPSDHNQIVVTLLLLCAEWHSLAKLRMHTEETLHLLENATDALSQQFSIFLSVTCAVYKTRETAKEQRARFKHSASNKHSQQPSLQPVTTSAIAFSATASATTTPATEAGTAETAAALCSDKPQETVPSAANSLPSAGQGSRLHKRFNVATYKYHALANYVHTIRRFGTTDSYTTERGELEHKLPKSWYKRTDKKTYRLQIAKMERRRTNIRNIKSKRGRSGSKPVPDLRAAYHIGKTQKTYHPLSDFVANEGNKHDPALKGFIRQLQLHLLSRLKTSLLTGHRDNTTGSPQDDEASFVSIQDSRIYSHKIIRIRYTTYDVRRAEDIVRVQGDKTNIMIRNPNLNETGHPFLYARVLGIYHANVVLASNRIDLTPQRMYFLWVRWYRLQENEGPCNLQYLSFPDVTESGAFGFLDPEDVVRGSHIIPRFSLGTVVDEIGLSQRACDGDDYVSYYVNKYADRDMSMRYRWGSGVGHRYPRSACSSWMSNQPKPSTDAQHNAVSGDAEMQTVRDEQLPIQCSEDNDEQDVLNPEEQLTEDHMVFPESDESDLEDDPVDDSEESGGE